MRDVVAIKSWHPPTAGSLKINLLSAAAVYRNYQGRLLKVRLCKKNGADPLKGEAVVARLAFSLAEDMNGGDIMVEGDSLLLVDQILNIDCIPDWCIEGEVTIIRKLHVDWKIACT